MTHFRFSISLIIGYLLDITWHGNMAATSSLCGRSVTAEALITGRQAVITSELDGSHRNSINGLENVNQLTASLK
jgi:hypothetical protein